MRELRKKMKKKFKITLLLLAFVMIVSMLIPGNKLYADDRTIVSGENEAANYTIDTKNSENKQQTEIELTLTPKENIELQSIIMPDGSEQTYLGQPINHTATENGIHTFKVKYSNSMHASSEILDGAIGDADKVLTADISLEISDIIQQSDSIAASDIETNHQQVNVTQFKGSTAQVSDFNELNSALSNPDITVIELLQNIGITDTLQVTTEKKIIAATPISLIRKSNFKNSMIIITETGSLTLSENVIVDGAEIYVEHNDNGSAITVYGNIQLDGCIIRNHMARIASPLVIMEGGNAILNRGEISNNSKTDGLLPLHGGGAVIVHPNGELIMNGGSIHDNSTVHYGGGVCILANGRFILNNGKIYNNKATHGQSSGGGIYAQGKTMFHMYNGEIYSNEAGDGGGMCLGSAYDDESKIGDFIIEKGVIRNNKAFYTYGGGIFLPSPYNKLSLKNVYIGENNAQYGGGIYDCPTGESKLYITNGSAFIDNTATVAGNLLYKVDSANEFYISSRVLGGFKQFIYNDFNPRYQSGDTALDTTKFQNVDGQLLLHNEIAPQYKALVKEQAGLIIEGNSAEMTGGGIGNNGSLIIGEDGADKTVKVSKIWKSKDSDIPASITVELIRIDGFGNEAALESIELNEKNEWRHTFEDLPGEFDYTVKEQDIEGFVPAYEEIKNGNETQIKITNTLETVDKTLTKIWHDDDNRDGIRPTEVRVQLYADGKAVGESSVLNEKNSWTAAWSDLAKYINGEEIVYSVKEITVPNGYMAKLETDIAGNFILTNTHTPEKNDTPSTPSIKPETPDTPANNSNKPPKDESYINQSENSIQTGDRTNLLLYCIGVSISFVGIAFIIIKKRNLKKR